MPYRQQWEPPQDSELDRFLSSTGDLAEQQSKLAREWHRISRAWALVAVLFALSALLHITNLFLLWK